MKAVFIGGDGRTCEIATLAMRLRWPDVSPVTMPTAVEGLETVERESPDVVLLHPDFDDLTLAKAIQELRGFTNVPLLVLGRKGDEMELVTSLELGADDYIRLPCDLTEIMIRIWALLRRAGGESEGPLRSGHLFVNPATYKVFLGECRVFLTPAEFLLLHLLMKNRGIVMPLQTLERALRHEYVDVNSGLVKKYVQRLRRKLGDNAWEPLWIDNVYGVGYRFVGPPPEKPT
ncbi:MAG TPA: response regulator transcription factor [Candidatus Paceibacterota bacterium]|nr:response regulator transcription factor [Candidatus Paceibacterota bacterium]